MIEITCTVKTEMIANGFINTTNATWGLSQYLYLYAYFPEFAIINFTCLSFIR